MNLRDLPIPIIALGRENYAIMCGMWSIFAKSILHQVPFHLYGSEMLRRLEGQKFFRTLSFLLLLPVAEYL